MNSTQAKQHLLQHCPLCPDHVKVMLGASAPNSCRSGVVVEHHHHSSDVKGKRALSPGPTGASESPHSASSGKRTKSAASFADHCDSVRAAAITFAIVQFIVGCALPFNIVNTIFFIGMIRELNAAYLRYLPKVDSFRRKWLPELYTATKSHVVAFFQSQGALSLRTLGFDGFKTVGNQHVVIVVETCKALTAMCEIVDPGTRHEDAAFYAQELQRILESRAAAASKPVQEVFCGVVGDNVRYNRNALDVLSAVFPLLFYIGCVAHCLSLLISDMCAVDEMENFLEECKQIVKFVKGHKYVWALFKQTVHRKDKNGALLVLYPATRFAYLALMLDRLIQNREHLDTMVGSDAWRELRLKMSTTTVKEQADFFELHINDVDFWKKVHCAHSIIGPVADSIHFIEKQSAKCSWVMMLFTAIVNDLQVASCVTCVCECVCVCVPERAHVGGFEANRVTCSSD